MLAVISMAMVSSGIARAAQEVKFLFPEPTSSALTYPEGQMLGVYCGAFDFHMKELPVLRGRYAARWVGDLYKSPEDVLNAVAMGAGQFTYTTPYFIEQFDPEWRVLLTPGLVKDMSHFIRIMNTPEWKAKQEELAKNKGFRILKWPTTMGNFFVYTNKGPIEKVEDLKGVKIRYAGQQTFGNAFKKLGIIGVAMPYSEVVSSLQTNMIDGHIDNILRMNIMTCQERASMSSPIISDRCRWLWLSIAHGGMLCRKKKERLWSMLSTLWIAKLILIIMKRLSLNGGIIIPREKLSDSLPKNCKME